MKTIQSRNYGIDLLRLVLMYMVCMLHVLGHGGVLSGTQRGGVHHAVFWFMETLAYCAVDGFGFISGYIADGRKREPASVVRMWLQVWFYSFVLSGILSVCGVGVLPTAGEVVSWAFPLSFNVYWYFGAYFVLLLAMPILNKFLFDMDERAAKRAFIAWFFVACVMGILGDPMRIGGGYSAIWLIVLYCLGVLARKIRLFECKRTITLVLLWLVCNVLTWGLLVFAKEDVLLNIAYSGLTLKRNVLLSYESPTVLMSGILMVLLFARIPLKGKIIRHLSPLAFGVYLFHLTPVLWNGVLKGRFRPIASQPIVIGVLLVVCSAALIFITGLAVEFLRQRLMKLIRANRFCEGTAAVVYKVLTKASAILK